jgi:hypothetical protein
MGDMGVRTKTDLQTQIEQEEKELKEAPVIQPIVGQALRCHICGQVFHMSALKPFDEHVEDGKLRVACPNCHPNRGQ